MPTKTKPDAGALWAQALRESRKMRASMVAQDTGLDCHYFNHGDQGASDFEKRHGIGRSSAARW